MLHCSWDMAHDTCNCFFIFDIFIFHAVSGIKGQKITQGWKKFCLSYFISQEPYIIWSWLMVHMHNISRCFFYIFFQVLIFGVISRAKEHKMAWNDKNYLCCNLYLSKHASYDCAFCCTSLKWWHLQMFFSFFSNFVFPGC